MIRDARSFLSPLSFSQEEDFSSINNGLWRRRQGPALKPLSVTLFMPEKENFVAFSLHNKWGYYIRPEARASNEVSKFHNLDGPRPLPITHFATVSAFLPRGPLRVYLETPQQQQQQLLEFHFSLFSLPAPSTHTHLTQSTSGFWSRGANLTKAPFSLSLLSLWSKLYCAIVKLPAQQS